MFSNQSDISKAFDALFNAEFPSIKPHGIDRESPLYLSLCKPLVIARCDICGYGACRCHDEPDGDDYEERQISENAHNCPRGEWR